MEIMEHGVIDFSLDGEFSLRFDYNGSDAKIMFDVAKNLLRNYKDAFDMRSCANMLFPNKAIIAIGGSYEEKGLIEKMAAELDKLFSVSVY